jgi:hypothetical protein
MFAIVVFPHLRAVGRATGGGRIWVYVAINKVVYVRQAV